MRLDKTLGDIKIIGGISPGDIGLYEVLNIVLDLLLDVRQETGKELSGLTVSGEAAAKWIAVVNALQSIPIEENAALLTKRRREKLPLLKKALAEREEAARSATAELETLQSREERLLKKQRDYQARLDELGQLRQSVSSLKADIQSMEAELAVCENIDLGAVRERRDRLQKMKDDRQRRIAVFNEYNTQLQDAIAALEKTKAEVNAVCDQIAQTERQQQQSEQELLEKQEALHQAKMTYDRRQDQIGEELAAAQAELEKLQAAYQNRCAERDTLHNALDGHQQRAQELDGEINRILDEIKAQEQQCEACRSKTESLERDLAQAQALAEQAQEELQALDDRRKDALWKLSALKERKSDFETKYQALMEDKNALTYAIQQKVSEIEACSRELEALQTESKQKDEKLQQTKAALTAAEEQLTEAETAESRMRVTVETLKQNLEDAKQRTTSAGEEEQTLKESLAEKNESVRQLTEDNNRLRIELEQQEQERLRLATVHDALDKQYHQLQSENAQAQKNNDAVKSEEEALRIRKEDLEKDKLRMENNLIEYQNAITLYESFFDSKECHEMQAKIDRMEQLVELYQDGVNSLFGSEAPPAEHLGNLQYQFDGMRNKLREQLDEVQRRMNGLSTDYLKVIARIEGEVNL